MPDLPALFPSFNPTEPVTKLVEAVRAGVGAWYEPARTRRKADADAYATRVAARAESDAALIRAQGSIEQQLLSLRAEERIKHLEMRRQQNIEYIADMAIDQLPPAVSDEPVDEDWMIQFFNYSQDVGNEEMQKLWARLLAGEVCNPGSFSLRTLQLVRLLRQPEAMDFRRFCNYLWEEEQEGLFHVRSEISDKVLAASGLSFTGLLELESLGLIQMPPFLATSFSTEKPILRYGNFRCIGPNKVKSRVLTVVGEQLATLCDRQPDEAYLNAVIESWKDDGIDVQELDTTGNA